MERENSQTMADQQIDAMNRYEATRNISSQDHETIATRPLEPMDTMLPRARSSEPFARRDPDVVETRHFNTMPTGSVVPREYETMATRGFETMSSRVPGVMTTREYEALVTRGLESMATREYEGMAPRPMETMATRAYETEVTRISEEMTTRVPDTMATRVPETLATTGTMVTGGQETMAGRNPVTMDISESIARPQESSVDRRLETMATRDQYLSSSYHVAPTYSHMMSGVDFSRRGVDRNEALEQDVARNLGRMAARSSIEQHKEAPMDNLNCLDLYSPRKAENTTSQALDTFSSPETDLARTRYEANKHLAQDGGPNVQNTEIKSYLSPEVEHGVSRGVSTMGQVRNESEERDVDRSENCDTGRGPSDESPETVDYEHEGRVPGAEDGGPRDEGHSGIHGNQMEPEDVNNRNGIISSEDPYERIDDEKEASYQQSESSEVVSEQRQEKEDIVPKLDDNEARTVDQNDETSESKSNMNVATKFVHILDEHSENFRHQIHQQWLKGQNCDLKVKVKDREFKVHSCVLAAFSPVICHMKRNMLLCLPEIKYASIAPLIKMMYSGILCIELADAPQVADTAKRLMMSDIHSMCQEYIAQCEKSGLVPGKVVQDDTEPLEMGGYDMTEGANNPAHTSGEEHDSSVQPVRRRSRAKRKQRRKPRRGRSLKLEEEEIESEGETRGEETVVMTKQEEELEEVDVEDDEEMDGEVDGEDEYKPDNEDGKLTFESRRRMWPPKKSSAVMKWLMSNRTDKPLPKHTKRDDNGRLKCPGCHKTFLTSEELQDHIENSSEHNAFRCTQCGVAYIRKSNLTRHMRTVHSNDFHLKCRFCNISTKTERELRAHCLEAHSNNSPFECEYPGCSYRTYKYDFLRRHKQIHSEQKDYVCDKCGKTFSQQAGLLSHHRTCYHLQEYLCDVCGQAFNHFQSMKSHRRSIHYGERPFMCPECGTRFSDHRNLKRHRRIHENAFPYACQICGQKYRHSNSLKAHMKKHSDVMSVEAASTTALISSYVSSDVEIGSQYSHPPISLPTMQLNQIHEYYASACDNKYVAMTTMAPATMPMTSNPIAAPMNSAVTSVGLDTLAELCLSSSVG